MSCINAVVAASDEELIKVHLEFKKWKHVWSQKTPARAKTDFGWALRHHDRCQKCVNLLKCVDCNDACVTGAVETLQESVIA